MEGRKHLFTEPDYEASERTEDEHELLFKCAHCGTPKTKATEKQDCTAEGM